MKRIIENYINSFNNILYAKGGREVFPFEEGISDIHSLRFPFDNSKLYHKKEIEVYKDDLLNTIARSQEYFLRTQHKEGFWIGELEANTTLTSEYIMFMHFMGTLDQHRQMKMVNHLLRMQQDDGSWNICYGAKGDLSTTIEAYFAMKLAGISEKEPFMKKGKRFILNNGGISASRVFTKIFLAIFDQFDWDGIPAMPVELILIPNSAYINIYEFSSWSRSVIVPLTIIFAKKPVIKISGLTVDELYTEADRRSIDYSSDMKRFEISWDNLFRATDSILKFIGRSPFKPFRNIAIKRAERWILEHQDHSGDWGGIIPAMMNSIMALNCLGYRNNHPVIKKGLEAIERFSVKDTELDEERLQSCISPVWDTAIATNALSLSGFSKDHHALVKSVKWLISKQITKRKGDWKVKNPNAEPGGWAFEFDNDFYPDNDDTAEVLMAINRIDIPDIEKKKHSLRRGINWLMSMQSSNGGWGAFDMDNDKEIINNIPFSDLKSLLDPPSCDVTGRILWMLGQTGYDRDFIPAKRAIEFIKANQEPDGPWYGRWGVNYIYGTCFVLNGLNAMKEDMNQRYIKKAVNWLKAHQNIDGGWGETCRSYDDKNLKGIGKSTASQTAWALLGLMAAGEADSESTKKGINYLIERQNMEGSWDENEFTGTGFPRHFYIRYHMYRDYFPLLALAEYKKNTVN